MIIGLDVDGVLADFNRSFIDHVIHITGRDLFPPRPFDIPTWNYPEHYGYTKEETSNVWGYIKRDRTFWQNLHGYPDSRDALDRLWCIRERGSDVYFITNRMGIAAKQQTENWLRKQGFDNPTVLLTADKGGAARVLGLDVYVDDRWENAVDVSLLTRKARPLTYLVTRPWNASNDEGAFEIVRVSGVGEFVTRYCS